MKLLGWIAQKIAILFVAKTDLKDQSPLIVTLADKVYDHRKKNNGLVPFSVFEPLIGMGGMYPCLQIVHEVVINGERVGFALRLRDQTEAGDTYKGKYHNTCCSLRMGDSAEEAIARNLEDACGIKNASRITFIGVTICDEPERRSDGLTLMYLHQVTPDQVQSFRGHWKIFSEQEIQSHPIEVVDSNWHQLAWVIAADRPTVCRVRSGHE